MVSQFCITSTVVFTLVFQCFKPHRNDKDEAKFNEICVELAKVSAAGLGLWNQWQEIKVTRPKIHSGLLLSLLIVLAWIGNLFNNLLLTYLIALVLVELPGLKHHGLIEKHLGNAINSIKNAVGEKLKQK